MQDQPQTTLDPEPATASRTDPARPIVDGLSRTWGLCVAAARTEAGLTQLGLARSASVSQQTISKIERGNMLPVDALKLRLAAALSVPASRLFPWPDEQAGGRPQRSDCSNA